MAVEVDENHDGSHDIKIEQPIYSISYSKLLVTDSDKDNHSQLQWIDAAGHGKLDDMKQLLQHGADVGWKDDQKRTALHICAGHGYYELVSLLLEHGASVNAEDENSTTALHLATWHGKTEVVRLLLDYDADLEAKDDNLETALHMAVSRGIKKLVQLLLHRGASIKATGYRSQTTLHLASSIGHKEVVKLLLYSGAIVDAKNEDLDTALHKATENGHLSIVELLLNSNASADEKNTDSWTSLHLAASNGKNDVVQLLVDRGVSADVTGLFSYTPLHRAAINGNEETVKILLNHGASIDAANDSSDTPLMLATIYGHSEVVSILLRSGAFVDWKSDDSGTALYEAVCLGRVDIVKLLLSHGASIEKENDKTDTLFHIAAKNGHKEVLSLLLSNFGCVNQTFKDGRTLLAERSEVGDIQMITFLLQHGADIDALDANGKTSLAIAITAAQPHVASLLINEGADIEVTDNSLWTALHWSANDGHVAMLELLLQKKANIEAKTNRGNTALHLAAEMNHSEIVATLIEHKANIDAKNDYGNSPIQVALMKGHYEIIQQLKNAGATIENSEDNEQWLLYHAADVGQVELVKKALESYDEAERIQYMNTALCRASQHGKLDVVSYLLDNGADIKAYDHDGLPLLFLAGEHPGVVSKLLDRGACIEERSVKHRNQSVLHYFASLGRIDTLRLLWACDCNIHSTDDDSNTALHYAVKNNYYDVTTLLLEQGIDINATNNEGETALHIAIKHGSTELAKLLIDNGIDIETKTLPWGTTALHLAIENESPAIISLLLERHANVNAIDEMEYTPFDTAVLRGMTEVCALLIDHGANVDIKNSERANPLQFAVSALNPDLVKLLLHHGASVHIESIESSSLLNIAIESSSFSTGYRIDRDFIEVVKLLINAGASTAGVSLTEDLKERFPTLQGMVQAATSSSFNNGNNVLDEALVVQQHLQDKDPIDIALKRFGGNHSKQYGTSIFNERWLIHTKHKYGYDLPLAKRLKLDDFLDVDGTTHHNTSMDSLQSLPSLKLLSTAPTCNRAIYIIQSLLDSFDAQLFMSDYFFMLELDGCVATKPPKWASHFDKMDGIIREPGRLVVQIPQIKTSLSIPAWHRSTHPCLRFIDAVYVCRRSSTRLDQEEFSDLLGGSEQRLATDLHAILIAGLSILSTVGGDGLVEKLVMAILNVKLDSSTMFPSNDKLTEWQIRNRRQCPCNAASFHRPLSPVAAAKAVGIDIWQDRDYQVVNRVWDLHQDKLVLDVDAREVIFVTHRWGTNEIRYQDILKMKRWRGQTVGRMSKKLHRIRNALLDHTRYVWMDTICIDKSNLSELDESIRSMYKWYASCAAVVLDSGAPLDVWCKRGWCLQEGAAAGILCGISKEGNLVTMQQLAKEQNQNLCSLDLHLYYRQGNAAEILARMDVRDTTRKEDMAYSLAGIFDIHLTLAYGEGIKSRMRLFHELATQKGDLSFLSFRTTRSIDRNYLPTINQINYVLAECTEASTSINVSHFGICFEVQLLKAVDAKKTLQMLKSWKLLNFAIGRSSGIDELYEATEKMEHQGLPVELAIVHEIRSLILVQTYNADWQAGGGKPLKLCYRIQCCQIEEIEFKRLFDKYRALQYERIWLGDRPSKVNISQFESEWSRRVNI